jgi:DNA-binding NarL/FixJ family response regulator
VLSLMAEGNSNDAIAKSLHISGKTVETHIASIFVKLGIDADAARHRRVQAVVKYLKESQG